MPIHDSGKYFQLIGSRTVKRIYTHTLVRVVLKSSGGDAGSVETLYQNNAEESCVMAPVYVDGRLNVQHP